MMFGEPRDHRLFTSHKIVDISGQRRAVPAGVRRAIMALGRLLDQSRELFDRNGVAQECRIRSLFGSYAGLSHRQLTSRLCGAFVRRAIACGNGDRT